MMEFHLHIQKMLQGDFQLMRLNIAFVFQVNCPGCFIYGIPLLNELFCKHADQIGFIGVSTAFEDFELNTEANTVAFLKEGKLTGETKKYFDSVTHTMCPPKINFPVAFDRLTNAGKFLTNENILLVCRQNLNFGLLSSTEHQQMLNSVKEHYKQCSIIAETFTLNQLPGTPSIVIFDNHNTVLQSLFGHQDKELIELFLQHYLSLNTISV